MKGEVRRMILDQASGISLSTLPLMGVKPINVGGLIEMAIHLQRVVLLAAVQFAQSFLFAL